MKHLLWIIILAAVLMGCQPKAESAKVADEIEQVSKEEQDVMALVHRGAQLVEEQGQTEEGMKAVVEQFQDPEGDFVHGDYYIFMYDFNGTVLALQMQPELIGVNRIDAVDANGERFIEAIVNTARDEGEGWVEYMYPCPSSGEVEQKHSFIERVGQMDVLVGSGFYRPAE